MQQQPANLLAKAIEGCDRCRAERALALALLAAEAAATLATERLPAALAHLAGPLREALEGAANMARNHRHHDAALAARDANDLLLREILEYYPDPDGDGPDGVLMPLSAHRASRALTAATLSLALLASSNSPGQERWHNANASMYEAIKALEQAPLELANRAEEIVSARCTHPDRVLNSLCIRTERLIP